MLQAGAELLIEETATRVEEQRLISQKQTLGGDRSAAKVIAVIVTNKKWENTNQEQKCTQRLGTFINIKLPNEQDSVKLRKHKLVPLQF